MKQLDTPSRIFELAVTELEGLRLPAEAAQFIFDAKIRAAAEVEWTKVAAQNATIVTFGCAAYPERLREIYGPPPVLWLRGDVRLLSRPAIAVVGTRHPSSYGTGVAEMLARDLAARRLLIVSGMARAIDSHAHKGALAAPMPTLAEWGTGVDVVYPKENRKLAESGENSGTRVTARCATEHNRDLFAVPGNVTSKGSRTPNTLIKQSAKLVATWEHVWEDLPSQVRLGLGAEDPAHDRPASKHGAGASLLPDPDTDAEEAMVLEVLRSDESLQIDEILELLETQLTSSEVFTALFELETAGPSLCLPGKKYIKTL